MERYAVNITEVRIKLMEDASDRLRGFCSITFDDAFVVRDLKIIEGSSGPFVAMPSRKLTAHCPQCGGKNHLRAGYCNNCGFRLRVAPAERTADGRAKLYADIAHPINSECREMIQNRVIEEYEKEVEHAKQPGYRSRYDDYYGDAGEDYYEEEAFDDRQRSKSGESSQDQAHPPQPNPSGPHQSNASSAQPQRKRKFGQGIFEE